MKKNIYLNNKDYLMLLIVIIILGAGLRIYNLGTENYWYDEFIMIRVAGNDFTYIYDQDLNGRPPVYVIFAHFWIKLFGTSETATRSLSAIFGVVSIPMMYLVGKQLYNRKLGILSAFLISISQFQIYYSQEFRYYSLFLLITLSSYYFYIKFIKQKKYIDLVLCSILNIFLVYTHFYGLFIIFAQGLFITIRYRKFKSELSMWLISQILIFACIFPIIYHQYLQKVENVPRNTDEWVSFYTLITLTFNYLYKFLASGVPWDAIYYSVYPMPSILHALVGLIFLSSSIYIYNRVKRNKYNFNNKNNILHKSIYSYELIISVLWFICPIFCALSISFLLNQKYPIRYIIAASPAFYLLLSFFIIRIQKIIPVFVSIGFMTIMIVPGLAEYYIHDVKIQWEETANYIKQSTTEEDILIIPDLYCPKNENDEKYHWSDVNKKNFNWYYNGELQACCMDIKIEKKEFDFELNKCIANVGSFWLVLDDIVDFDETYYNKFLKTGDLTQTKFQKFYQVRAYSFNIGEKGSN